MLVLALHTYSIKTNILCFFSQATIGKKHKKHTKTNILLFSADIHTYKLTFVSFFMFFFAPSPYYYCKTFTSKNRPSTVSGGPLTGPQRPGFRHRIAHCILISIAAQRAKSSKTDDFLTQVSSKELLYPLSVLFEPMYVLDPVWRWPSSKECGSSRL